MTSELLVIRQAHGSELHETSDWLDRLRRDRARGT